MPSSDTEKYRNMDDHDLAILTAAKLDALAEKLDNFVTQKDKLQAIHECRMDNLEEEVESHDSRINTLETYFKVSVGALVLAVTVFGVYVLELILR